jgi:hypothetical protein
MTPRSVGLPVLYLVVGLATTAPAQAPDPAAGTWTLNLAKSKFSPGPPPKSQTLKYEALDGGVKLSVEGVNAEGQSVRSGYTAKFDGNEYPVTGNPNADTISLKRIDSHSFEARWKKDGKPTLTIRTTISKDGKTRTSVQSGKNAQGQEVSNTIVYDKQ